MSNTENPAANDEVAFAHIDESTLSSEQLEALKWRREVYMGDKMRQLTLRAVFTGMLLGSIVSVTNIYVSLKTTWSIGATITAAIVAYAIFKGLEKVSARVRNKPYTVLENYMMASTACSAGYMNAAGLGAAIPALYMIMPDVQFTWWQLMLWLWAVAVMGLFMAGPLKRRLINVEKLAFPTGTAAAETIRSLHATGKGAMRKAKVLLFAMVASGLIAFWREFLSRITIFFGKASDAANEASLQVWGMTQGTWNKFLYPDTLPLWLGTSAKALLERTAIGWNATPLYLAFGGIIGIRVGLALLIGAILFFGVMPASFEGDMVKLHNQVNSTENRTPEEIARLKPTVEVLHPEKDSLLPDYLSSVYLNTRATPEQRRQVTDLIASAGTNPDYETQLEELGGTEIVLFAGTPDEMTETLIVPGDKVLGYKGIVAWALWPSTALMVAAGLTAFVLQWKTIMRAFGGFLGGLTGRKKEKEFDALADIETPGWWFWVGTGSAGLLSIILAKTIFGIDYHMGVFAVLLTFLLAIVAARATGETDVNPVGAMGKITQLSVAAIPHSTAVSPLQTNLMTASITAGAATHSSELLQDLKAGYILGGNARKQTIAQFFGTFAGVIACVPVFQVLVKQTDANGNLLLGSDELPAPAALVWKGVAELLEQGFATLPDSAKWGMAIGLALGVIITVMQKYCPKKVTFWLPSPIGLAVAGVVPANNSIMMFLGALLVWYWRRRKKAQADTYSVPVASGLIAGNALVSVLIILLAALVVAMK
ncbi:OPT family oligopeptide transporter [Haloferula sp. A504]|uniref:OPT family oligopeptide transporter n=1 Tax=Haloferula sp. A504 TaxID=3373601 RepID=UPI0031BC6E0A|nr:OPT/YSL family transporter [Verrucomicrobiaceae bacterium E54]